MRREVDGKLRYLYEKQSMAMHKVRQRKMKSEKEGVHLYMGSSGFARIMQGLAKYEGVKDDHVLANVPLEHVGSNTSDDQHPAPRMSSPGAPASTRVVAPPAHIDWSAISGGQKSLRQARNQARVGMVPLLQSQRWGWRGNK